MPRLTWKRHKIMPWTMGKPLGSDLNYGAYKGIGSVTPVAGSIFGTTDGWHWTVRCEELGIEFGSAGSHWLPTEQDAKDAAEKYFRESLASAKGNPNANG